MPITSIFRTIILIPYQKKDGCGRPKEMSRAQHVKAGSTTRIFVYKTVFFCIIYIIYIINMGKLIFFFKFWPKIFFTEQLHCPHHDEVEISLPNDNRTGPTICCNSLIFSQVYGPIWLKNVEKYKNVFTCVSELVKFLSSFKYCNYNFFNIITLLQAMAASRISR
ncbi:unnamed protein product [Meganyctiphanes norvegica]|uniref:Uncharacterized protein n=1 Tax=Meganyctiphanes norvegica TaxID=48144 RepID=A0AAV2RTQ5_MEGNR